MIGASVVLHSCLAATANARTTFELARLNDWRDLAAPLVALTLALVAMGWLYRRDAHELPRMLRWALMLLRVVVFAGLFVLYLDPQWRTQDDPRVVVAVDTSSSMGIRDVGPDGRQAEQSRYERLAASLEENAVIEQLRKTHEVVVATFDSTLSRPHMLPRLPGDEETSSSETNASSPDGGVSDAPTPGRETTDQTAVAGPAASDRAGEEPASAAPRFRWNQAIAPKGAETRLGESLERLVEEERFGRATAIFVVSDGGQNAGPAPEAAVIAATEAGLPIHTIGIGALVQPQNIRVDELSAPPRVRPGDAFSIAGVLRFEGDAEAAGRRQITAELWRRGADAGQGDAGAQDDLGVRVDSQTVTLGQGGQVAPVRFKIEPKETGRFTYALKALAPPGDFNADDDRLETDVEVVERKDRVLLLAGGPSRDYRFLRPQLYRDESVTVDVYLQTQQTGVSQEADNLLLDFPATKEEMDQYDCVVAFDPDWTALSDGQIDLLDHWVGSRGGGLVVTAGPVHAGAALGGWATHPRMRKIRALYPVEFDTQGSVLDSRTRSSMDKPWKLAFTAEGDGAEYLWLANDPIESRKAWKRFPGVYSFQAVKSLKPAAVPLAVFGDARVKQSGVEPIYFAEQFYGSGRVFYIGSAEIWRLRSLDVSYFEQFYTQLIRHAAQGRLLRDSDRATLSSDRERYIVGSTVVVRARLNDARSDPLELPAVTLDVIAPDGETLAVELAADPGRAGAYVGRFTVIEPGGYRLELPVPRASNERVSRRIQVRMPDLEMESPCRNAALLNDVAEGTGGVYFENHAEALDPASESSIYAVLSSNTESNPPPSSPDLEQERFWITWLMGVLCGVLCLEWLIRRLVRLA